jgi:hypothetical protein
MAKAKSSLSAQSEKMDIADATPARRRPQEFSRCRAGNLATGKLSLEIVHTTLISVKSIAT